MVRCESVFPALPPISRVAPGEIFILPLPWMTPFVQCSTLPIPSVPVPPTVPFVPSSSSVVETLPFTSHCGAATPWKSRTEPGPVKLAPVPSVCVPPQNQSAAPAAIWNCPELLPPIRLSWPLRSSTRPALLKSGPCGGIAVPNWVVPEVLFRKVPALLKEPPPGADDPENVPSANNSNVPPAKLLIAAPRDNPRSPLDNMQRPRLLSAHPESCRLVPTPPLISMVAFASMLRAARLSVPLPQFSTAVCAGLPRTWMLPSPLHDERISRLPVENTNVFGFRVPTWAVPSMVPPVGQRFVPSPVRRLVVPTSV